MLGTILAIQLDTLILDIFIVLGIVVAVSLIVYFIWEAILAHTSKGEKTEKASDSAPATKKVAPSAMEDFYFEDVNAGDKKLIEDENIVDVDAVKAKEEETALNNETKTAEAEQERLERERREFLEKRRLEVMRFIQEEDEDDDDEEEIEEEQVEEPVQEAEEVQETTTVEETVAETVDDEALKAKDEEISARDEEIQRLEEEKQQLIEEKEKYAQMVKELEEAKQNLVVAVTEAQPVPEKPAYTLDELKARLADMEEKLRENEKELKVCKKDFIPLNKVWKTHEKDQKKLRRKEALVAKQKVVLYGVNNYADIDEEKAKKLAEDLDLYDGLKLSVQNCEEVMAKNAERYPLLKRMYEVLMAQNQDYKDEIKKLKDQIAKLEEGTEEE